MKKDKPLPSIDDLLNFPLAVNAQISPDGSLMTCPDSKADWAGNERVSHIRFVSLENPQSKPMS